MKHVVTVYIQDLTEVDLLGKWVRYHTETDLPFPPHAAFNPHESLRYIEDVFPDLKGKCFMWSEVNVTVTEGTAKPRRLN